MDTQSSTLNTLRQTSVNLAQKLSAVRFKHETLRSTIKIVKALLCNENEHYKRWISGNLHFVCIYIYIYIYIYIIIYNYIKTLKQRNSLCVATNLFRMIITRSVTMNNR